MKPDVRRERASMRRGFLVDGGRKEQTTTKETSGSSTARGVDAADEDEEGRRRRQGRGKGRMQPETVDFDVDFVWFDDDGMTTKENVLVLLHGDLDCPENFVRFGKALALPKTAVLALGAPLDASGRRAVRRGERARARRWFTSAEEGTGEDVRQRMVTEASGMVRRGLMRMRDERGWSLDRVHVYGFSDGGTVALDLASQMTGKDRLGSCAVTCASLLPYGVGVGSERYGPLASAPTPVIFTASAGDAVVPLRDVERTAELLVKRNIGCGGELHVIPGKSGHGMVSSAEETRVLMTFWSKTLTMGRARAEDYGDDVVELTTDTGE